MMSLPDVETPYFRRLFSILIVILLLAPLSVSGPIVNANSFVSVTWPRVHSGDEPHYLVLIHSVVNDGDLDVKNNYFNVHRGRGDAGVKFAGWPLDHHVTWYDAEVCVRWWEVYETDPFRWTVDAEGHPSPTPRVERQYQLEGEKEYSQHAPGLALILSPILVLFRDTKFLEPVALLATAIVTACGFFGFCSLVRPYVVRPIDALFFGAIAYLGSPLWHYGRTLYVEPYAATFVVCAYAAVLRWNRYFLGGCLLGFVVLLKSPFAMIAIPIVAEALWQRRWINAIFSAVPVGISVGITLIWNRTMWGGWRHAPQRWEWGYPLEGAIGLLFSWKHGILLFAPALLVSAFCARLWFQRHQRDAFLISSGILVYFSLMSCYMTWWGGDNYSARYLIPVLPLMFAPLALLRDLDLWKRDPRIRVEFSILIAISIVFGSLAAYSCENVWNKHPIQLLISN